MLRAVVFDFDGLIVDTETPLFEVWREVFEEHGQDLPVEHLLSVVGSADHFDPVAHLAGLLGAGFALDEAGTRERIKRTYVERVLGQPLLPGVADRVREADRLGWTRSVASSSSRDWVAGHLERLGLTGWVSIRTRDDVARAKPHPDVYLQAARDLGVKPAEAIALEDSPNGVRAAKAAGLRCAAVPRGITAGLDVGEADLVFGSLAEMRLAEVAARLG